MSVPVSADPGAAPVPPGDDAKQRVPGTFVLVHFLALLGAWMGVLVPSLVSVALKVERMDAAGKVGTLSLALGVGALVALVANPLFGLLSDRTTSRFGARRPWMVIGTAGGFVGIAVIAYADSTWEIVVGWCLAQCFYNALVAAIYGALADQVPERQMGFASAVLALANPLATLGGTFLVDALNASTTALMLVPALVGAALVVPFLLYGRDRRVSAEQVPSLTPRQLIAFLWTNPVRFPDFGWAWLSRFLMWTSYATVTTYMAYYLSDYLHQNDDAVTHYVFLGSLVANIFILIATVPAGRISDRIGRRKPIVFAAAVLLAASMGVMALATSVTGFLIAQAIVGIGMGVYFAVDIALPADVLPDPNNAAKDLGVMNIAATLPYSLITLIAPTLLALGGGDNYPALFVFGLLAALCAIPAVLPVKRR
ncbi:MULTISPECIES: MFS transporter [unclassified Streptomyces]|uniref:MFS transporter n=1 Tax=unclassified Streptomyces TaxID=2593676 RepID=UPI000DC4BCE9|nr:MULTISPECIES: MFS transporter [unclassified Streptomyces]MYT72908.1 MFS transporter [Streptomyces sp. SID8367]RAJ78884.1 Na+/melibiose symporter-like transporter [Streptomyces sp. PsTaAH-137]